MNTEFDLATLAEDLAAEIPQVSELYLFGSRARGTKSTRSDVDVLVVSDGFVKPQQLREFSSMHCPALDLFTVNRGTAISSQNESFIEAESFSALLKSLGAKRIWSRSEGREKADIAWKFKIRDDVAFVPTALPNTSIDVSQPGIDPSKLTLFQLLGHLTADQLYKLGGAILTVLFAVATAAYWVGKKLGG